MRLKTIWDKVGFYVILGLSVATVALTAYFTKSTDEPLPTIPPEAKVSATPAATVRSYYDFNDGSVEAVASPAPTIAPILMPAQGEIVCGFSTDVPVYNETLGHYAVHSAVDIAAKEGTPVQACADGRIAAVYEDAMLGNVIEIEHNGFTAVYASLKTIGLVREGDPVSAGQTLSFAGTCAGEQHLGVHLHFAVIEGDSYVDPVPLFQ